MKTIKTYDISNFDVRIEFFDVWKSQVIILEQNVLVMNKSQAEKKVYAFHAVFRVDVNDVKPFQKRRHWIISLIRNLYQDFLKQ